MQIADPSAKPADLRLKMQVNCSGVVEKIDFFPKNWMPVKDLARTVVKARAARAMRFEL
jgi:hypothetical protein